MIKKNKKFFSLKKINKISFNLLKDILYVMLCYVMLWYYVRNTHNNIFYT